MAPKSLAEQIADLEDLAPRDFDPEDIDRGGNSSDEDAPVKDADAGREHYQAVGKAKLRNEDPISLGKQYAASRVSREALEAESDDDPFAARSDESDEEGSEEGSDEGEEDEDEDEDELSDELDGEEDEDEISASEDERPRKSKSAGKKGQSEEVDAMETGSEDSDEDMEGFDEDEFSDEDDEDDEEDEEDEDEDEDEDEEDEDEKPSKRRVKFADPSDDREQLRQLMATDQKTIAATISQAAKADAIKGKAVKQQRATFDALLNTRIKLQKGLTAVNQLFVAAAAAQSQPADDSDAFKSAESAAITLWSTLEDLRLTLADAQTTDESKKRKRPAPATTTTSTTSLWQRMLDLESSALAHRRAILDKWSAKVRGTSSTTLANSKTKLVGSTAQQTITSVLDAHVASELSDLRSAKRARKDTSTSTSTSASANPDQEPEPLYDDTVFYQSLLRDLVEQRMSSSDAITNGLDTLHLLPSSRNVHPVTGMRKDKVKRDVDTRASKGRKMRFDVHEKLQNFMAPEDRGTWTGHAREEFFASLLGKTASGLLREEDGEEEDADVDGVVSDADSEVDVEGGLRLFRS
ncbi:apoptosis antagonizing transcription factor-domain-containing protein [Aspergillus egyptiacus]|nr:apoptosis antagonizing transcription factor-domain-containing protein [Aspergillus egyptiacus]